MAKIKIKNSVTPGSVPSGLSFGEMAVNIADKTIFIGNAVEGVVTLYDQNNLVTSVNGATGAITNVAKTDTAQTFTATQQFAAGISADGATFATAIRVEGFVDVGLGGGANSTNLMVGNSALDANTSGLNNVAVGYASLASNTTGTSNSAIGANTLSSNTYGGTNTAIGSGALQYSISDSNTAIGYNSLNSLGFFSLGNGSNNTAIGTDAGKSDISLNPLWGFTGGVFVGYDTRAGANNGTNEIVIGYEGRGNGSNTTTIGNTSTTDAYIHGLLHLPGGISASASSNTLEVTSSTSNSAGIRVSNGHSGTPTRTGAIALGRSPTASHNTFIYSNSGVFQILNGIDYTSTKLLELDTSGADILNNSGLLTISKSSYLGNDSAVVRIVGADVVSTNYNSDIIANISASSNTVHTLPQLTGTLLNRNTIAAGSNIEFSVSGATLTISSTASGGGAGFTYTSSAPGSPEVGDRWMDSDTGKEYVYINDGDSSQWIQPVSTNGLIGVTYDPNTETYEVDANIEIQGYVSSDSGYRITSGAINSQSGTTYTLLGSDNGKVIVWDTATSATLTVPSGLAVGYNTTVIQTGTGGIGITGSGTTINSFEGKLTTAGQHAAVSIISYISDVFNVAGGLTG